MFSSDYPGIGTVPLTKNFVKNFQFFQNYALSAPGNIPIEKFMAKSLCSIIIKKDEFKLNEFSIK